MAQKFQRPKRKISSSSDKPLNLNGCLYLVGGAVVILALFMISSGFRDWIIDLVAILINTLVLSNLFLFNIVVILILLGLIFLVLLIYSKI